MIIKQLLDEDFVNYKKAAMFIGFPKCNFKCDKESGEQVCQNGALANAPKIEIETEALIKRYMQNDITNAIVIGGLEPFDSYDQLFEFITLLRMKCNDDVVIYTGYYKKEIKGLIDELLQFKNIIIKYGRYIPNRKKCFDEVLGVYLASDNQFAEKAS